MEIIIYLSHNMQPTSLLKSYIWKGKKKREQETAKNKSLLTKAGASHSPLILLEETRWNW